MLSPSYRGALAEAAGEAAEVGELDWVETLAVASGANSPTLTASRSVNAMVPNRKCVVGYSYDAGAARTLSTFTYNGVPVNIILELNAGSSGICIGYLDEADLPTDGENHNLTVVLNDNASIILSGVLYRDAPQGAPDDSDSDTGGGLSNTLTVAIGALVVTFAGSDIQAGGFTWANGENERLDEALVGASLAIGDIVGTAGTSQTTGGTHADQGGTEVQVCAAWNPS